MNLVKVGNTIINLDQVTHIEKCTPKGDHEFVRVYFSLPSSSHSDRFIDLVDRQGDDFLIAINDSFNPINCEAIALGIKRLYDKK